MKTALPKIAKDLAALVGIARRETSPDRIEAALADARAQIAAATGDREAAEAAYRDGLLDAPEAELEKRQAEKAAATVRLDRAEALVALLTQRLASVRKDQERAARKAVHDDATAKCDAIRARLPEEYRVHALAIRALLRDLAEAEVALKRAEPLMQEFGQIRGVEYDLRGFGGTPEEIVEETEVKLWVIDGRPEPIPAERQRDVTVNTQTGKGQLYKGSGGVPFLCSRYRFKRTLYRAAINGPHDISSLLNRVSLPSFFAHGEDFATAEPFRSADTALDYFSREIADRPTHDRPVLERFEMVTERREDGARIATPLRSVA